MTESVLPYTCIAVLISCANSFRDEKEEHKILSFTEELCPFDTDSIACKGKYRKIDIQSVTSKTNISFCQETDLLKVCMEKIQHTVKTVCNGKQGCRPVILNTSSSLWDNCERIRNVFDVSFSCIEQPTKTSQKGEKVKLVIGCVIGGVALMTTFLFVFLLIRRKRNEESSHEENEQQSDTIYSDLNEYNNLSFTKTSSAYTEITHPVNLEHYYNDAFWKNTFLCCSEQDDPNGSINYVSCSK